MERNLKELCFTISGLSTDFSILGRDKSLPNNVRLSCNRLGVELLDLDRQLYHATFIENDTKISLISDAIEVAADKANAVNKELDELTVALKKARKIVKSATETITTITEEYKKAMETIENAFDEVDRVLDILGVEVD